MNPQINIESLKPLSVNIPAVTTSWQFSDYLGSIKVRCGLGRSHYRITPGLYKTGNPTSVSDVFVSANYRLSFDVLRKNLKGLDAWILVIDTKGINVWCAAGKGTFGTDTIIKSVKINLLETIVTHRKLILPQLSAPGVAAHIVKEQTGFKVIYGPVRAEDIKAFIKANYKATREMREVTFPLMERAKLIPNDFFQGWYKLFTILAIVFVLSGIDKSGILFSKMLSASPLPLSGIIGAYFAGIVFTPLLLPYIPFRAFSVKGAVLGAFIPLILYLLFPANTLDIIATGLISIGIASFVAMNFTGSSTFTSLSGVKKEMKWSIPFQIAFTLTGFIVFITSKLI